MSTWLPPLSLTAGVLLLLVGLVDLISTAVMLRDGGGFLTQRTIRWSWRCWRWISKALGVHISRAGALILLIVFAQWALILVLGWGMVLHGLEPGAPWDEQLLSVGSLVIGRGKPPASLPNWIALGIGMSGVVLVSLTISYVIAVVGAVAYVRHVAAYLLVLGSSPESFIENNYRDGEPLPKFDLHIIALAPMLVHVAAKTLAFPVIDAFQPAQASRALSVRMGCTLRALQMLHRDESHDTVTSAAEDVFIRATDHLLAVYGHLQNEDDDDSDHGDEDDEARAMKRRLTDVRRWVDDRGFSWPDDVISGAQSVRSV